MAFFFLWYITYTKLYGLAKPVLPRSKPEMIPQATIINMVASSQLYSIYWYANLLNYTYILFKGLTT